MMQRANEREQTAKSLVDAGSIPAYLQGFHTFRDAKPAKTELLDLNELIDEMKWLLPLYGKGDIELILSLTEEKLPVLADKALMKEMLVDLVANATESSADGATLTLKTRIVRFKSQQSSGCVHFSVSNNGNKRERNEAALNVPGLSFGAKVRSISVGAGLSRVYTIIKQQHNGNIRIDVGPENGATVNIFLPLFG
jgi:nitrogen fixation/metabolism regulation signal transduction histidine kinase